MNIVALIQARMGSSRLPCKAMLYLHGLPLIDWVVHRTAKAELVDRLMVALPETRLDDILVRHLENRGIECFRGPEDDVLKRFCLAATHAEATHVIRICADNPLIWGGEIDHLIRHFMARPDQEKLYAYNHIPWNNRYPDGLGAEMLTASLLHELDSKAVRPEHREHCLSYIRDNADCYEISTFDPPDKLLHRPECKLDVDTAEDYRKLALMPIHADMPPREVLLRYPKIIDTGDPL